MNELQMRLLTMCVQNYSCEFQPSGPNYFSDNPKSLSFKTATTRIMCRFEFDFGPGTAPSSWADKLITLSITFSSKSIYNNFIVVMRYYLAVCIDVSEYG
jgi:hypothetical protein